MQVTEAEFAELIRRSNFPPRVLSFKFGPGWISIMDEPGNAWVHEEIKSMRDTTAPAPGQEGGA